MAVKHRPSLVYIIYIYYAGVFLPRLLLCSTLWLMPNLRLLLALLLFGCLAPLPALAQEATQRPAENLPQLLERANALKTFDLNTLYSPPAEKEFGTSLRLLGHGTAVLELVQGVNTFAAAEDGLAVGLTNGDLRVYGTLACAGMDDPLDSQAVLLGYGARARYLAAVSQSREGVSLYDLENCELSRRFELPGVVSMAMSRSGAWLALAAQNGDVLVGPPNSSPKPIPLKLDSMLGVGFGPNQGVLYAVSRSGEVALWDLMHDQELGRFTVEGGPFSKALFSGQFMVLTTTNNKRFSVDLTKREIIPFSRQLAQFYLQDKTLRYRTWKPVLRTRKVMGEPELGVMHSTFLDLIRVRDLDGADRCYDTLMGKPMSCRAANDWETIPLTPFGGFFLGKTGYRLADVVFFWDHDVLLSRFVPDRGWFLWWVKATRLREYNPLPGHLPERISIRADEAVTWTPVVPPPNFP